MAWSGLVVPTEEQLKKIDEDIKEAEIKLPRYQEDLEDVELKFYQYQWAKLTNNAPGRRTFDVIKLNYGKIDDLIKEEEEKIKSLNEEKEKLLTKKELLKKIDKDISKSQHKMFGYYQELVKADNEYSERGSNNYEKFIHPKIKARIEERIAEENERIQSLKQKKKKFESLLDKTGGKKTYS